MSWESPIYAMFSDMEMKLEGEVFRAVQWVGITVDKDELIKALEYDRGQYEKGYADAMATIVHCEDCTWWKSIFSWNGKEHKVCVRESAEPPRGSDDYCSFGERREDAN